MGNNAGRGETTDFSEYGEKIFEMLDLKGKANFCLTDQISCHSKAKALFGRDRARKFGEELIPDKKNTGEKKYFTLGAQLSAAFALESEWHVSYFDGLQMYTGNKSIFSTSPLEMKSFIDSIKLKRGWTSDQESERDDFIKNILDEIEKMNGWTLYDDVRTLVRDYVLEGRLWYDAWRIITCTNEPAPEETTMSSVDLNKVRENIMNDHDKIWPSLKDFSRLTSEEANKAYDASDVFLKDVKNINEQIINMAAIEKMHQVTSGILKFESSLVKDVLEYLFLSPKTYDSMDLYILIVTNEVLKRRLRRQGLKRKNAHI